MILQFGNLKIENHNDSKLHFNQESRIHAAPTPNSMFVNLTKRDIPKLLLIKPLSRSLVQP